MFAVISYLDFGQFVTTVTVDKYKFLLPGLSPHVHVWKAVAPGLADMSEKSESVGTGGVSFLVGKGSDMSTVAASWKKKEKEREGQFCFQ